MDTESQQPESPMPPIAASGSDDPTEEIEPESPTTPMWPTSPTPPYAATGEAPYGGSGRPPFSPPPSSPPPAPPYGDWYYGATPLPPSAPHRSRPGRVIAALVLVALLAGGLGAGLGAALSAPRATSPLTVPAPSAPPSNTPPPAPSNGSSSAIAKAVDPAVVDIDTDVASGSAAAGTGIIITAGGEVLTNNHVVDEATAIRVVTNENGTHTGRVIAVDPTLDIALVQIEGLSGLPHATLGNSSDVKVGDPVTAIGNAYGLGGAPSVVTGVVSATGQSITADDALAACGEQLSNLLQTTAPIESGDSGGPLVNSSGQVIGMDTAAESGNNASPAGFAIPINEARNVVSEMQAQKHTGGIIYGLSAFLGVETAPQCGGSSQPSQNFGGGGFGIFGGGFGNSGGNSGAGTASGVQIQGVVPGGPAQAAGLQGGDVITSVGGVKITTADGLKQTLVRYHPGQTVSVSYVDGSGSSHTTNARLEGIPE